MTEAIDLERARGPDDMVLYAIGDVHGRLDLLARMHDEIAADIVKRGAGDWRVVHLGDYVDRGPDSKGVVDFLVKARGEDARMLMLAGNHDVGFHEFLRTGDRHGIFARYGGAQTALSYGVELDFDGEEEFQASRHALAAAVPPDHVAFIEGLRFCESFGDFYFCHAGIRPGVPLASQDSLDLIWIREEFHRWADLHPKVVVHGHTPVDQPELLPNRVNVDTGAFFTGRLTALVVEGSDKSLMVVEGAPRKKRG